MFATSAALGMGEAYMYLCTVCIEIIAVCITERKLDGGKGSRFCTAACTYYETLRLFPLYWNLIDR